MEREIGERAKKVLMIIGKLEFPPPKLLIEDSDELTFTWLRGEFKYYMRVTKLEIWLTELNTSTIKTKRKLISKGENITELEFKSMSSYIPKNNTANSPMPVMKCPKSEN